MLAESHRTTVWAELFAKRGSVRYIDLEGDSQRDEVVDADNSAVIVPGAQHRVEPLTDAEFFVQFHREPRCHALPGGCRANQAIRPRGDCVGATWTHAKRPSRWSRASTSTSFRTSSSSRISTSVIDGIEQHRCLHRHDSFRPELFDRWLEIFRATVRSGWAGPNTDRADNRATGMACAIAQRFLGKGVWRPAGAQT